MANALKKLYNQGTALAAPEDNEAAAFREKQANIDAYNAATKPQIAPAPAPVYVAPLGSARYGDRPGEQRIDTSAMTRPLGSAMPTRAGGGPVAAGQPVVVGEPQDEAVRKQAEFTKKVNETGTALAAQEQGNAQRYAKAKHSIPPPESQAQIEARVQREEAASDAKQQQVVPAREGGGPLEEDQTALVGEARPETLLTESGKQQVVGQNGPEVITPKENSVVIPNEPSPSTATGTPRMKAFGPQQTPEDAQASQATQVKEAPSVDNVAAEYPLGSARQSQGETLGAPTPEQVKAQSQVPATDVHTPEELKFQRNIIKENLAKATLNPDKMQGIMDTLAAEKQMRVLNSMNPYGSEANHPGTLGKIEHGLVKAGNIAGDVFAPAVMANVPGTDLNKQVAANSQEGELADLTQKQEAAAAKASGSGVGKTPQEQTYHALMTGGPNGGPRINEATQKPYTEMEANVDSQGTGKTPEEEYVQSQMKAINPDTGKAFTRPEATRDFEMMKTGTKPLHGMEKRVSDYNSKRKLEDTPGNREAAQTAIEKSDTNAKAWAALPAAESKMRLQEGLTIEEQHLNNTGADSSQRGLKADDHQYTEDARHNLVDKAIETAQGAAEASDTSQLAASITPVLATMANIRAEGLNRINTAEMSRFMPANGSLGRWAASHVDQFLAGEIPPEYKNEVVSGLKNLESYEDILHDSNTTAINDTVRRGGVQPVVDKKTGKATSTEPSKPGTTEKVATPEDNKHHYNSAKGEIFSNDGKTWYDAKGKKIG